MSKTFKIKIRTKDDGSDFSSTIEIKGFSTLEILGIRSLLDGIIEEAMKEADTEETDEELEKEETND